MSMAHTCVACALTAMTVRWCMLGTETEHDEHGVSPVQPERCAWHSAAAQRLRRVVQCTRAAAPDTHKHSLLSLNPHSVLRRTRQLELVPRVACLPGLLWLLATCSDTAYKLAAAPCLCLAMSTPSDRAPAAHKVAVAAAHLAKRVGPSRDMNTPQRSYTGTVTQQPLAAGWCSSVCLCGRGCLEAPLGRTLQRTRCQQALDALHATAALQPPGAAAATPACLPACPPARL